MNKTILMNQIINDVEELKQNNHKWMGYNFYKLFIAPIINLSYFCSNGDLLFRIIIMGGLSQGCPREASKS